MSEPKNGAEIVLSCLKDQQVEVVFGYPGGALLPIYDALFERDDILHVLVRHEQGAVHAAEGYARSTGRCGIALVTSGPGATNAVTGIADAMMDSIPLVVLTGQVATHMIGNDAFQECDTIGITRTCSKHNYLVRDVTQLARIMHEAFYIATTGRPGPVVVDLPKDIQIAQTIYTPPPDAQHRSYHPKLEGDLESIRQAISCLSDAQRPIIYSGGGMINSGTEACTRLIEFVEQTGSPVTSTLMGLGAYPASGPAWLGMLGMHGTYEANMAMHECDVMLCIGARFDDRITGRLDVFSPQSTKIHVDIDPSSISKSVAADIGIIGDAGNVLGDLLRLWSAVHPKTNSRKLSDWWVKIDTWKARNCLKYPHRDDVIMPQHAIQRLYEKTRNLDVYITTEVGQHQMWAAQHFHFEQPNRFMTSGGLGTMGYGLPAAVGTQIAHPQATVIDIAGEASVLMTMQEISTAVQYQLPVKIFILNNECLGMVRQWQELVHGGRYSQSYSEALPDFVKLAEAYGAVGLRASTPEELDGKIEEMLAVPRPVLFDCRVEKLANCFPMIPSGRGHNEMIFESHTMKNASPDDMSGADLV